MMAFEGRFRDTERRAFGGNSGSFGAEKAGLDTGEILQSLDKDLITFRGCIDSIGTHEDNVENRQQIKSLRVSIKEKITTAENQLKNERKSRDPQNKIAVERLSRQLESQVRQFQSFLEKEQTSARKHSLSMSTPDIDLPDSYSDTALVMRGGPSPSVQSQAQSQLGMTQLEQREAEAEELQDLERDIVDLRDIQQDLAEMVNEQGDDIDRIDKNVAVAQVRVETGVKETGKAVVLKQKNTKLKFIIAGVVSGVILVIVIIIVIVLAVVLSRNNN